MLKYVDGTTPFMPATTKAKGDREKPFGLYEAMQFIPRFVTGENGCGVTVRLPDGYRERIREMSANEKYRHKTEEEIASLLTGTLKDGFEINIRWSASGPIFDVPGNSCGVFVDGSDREMREYVDHNVDTAQQTLVLYACLSIHLRNTLSYLSLVDKVSGGPSEPKGGGFFYTDIIFGADGEPSIVRDNKPADFPKRG